MFGSAHAQDEFKHYCNAEFYLKYIFHPAHNMCWMKDIFEIKFRHIKLVVFGNEGGVVSTVSGQERVGNAM